MTVKRWTDEMLDKLADKVDVLSDKVDVLSDKVDLLSDKVDDLTDNMQGLRVTTQALLQIAGESQQKMRQFEERQAENDARFNVLLEEVRYLIRRKDDE